MNMNMENLEFEIAIVNADRKLNSSLIYDELEDELVKKFDYNISLTRIDRKNSDISEVSSDFNILLNINVSLEITVLLELIVVANIFWNLYEKYIKPQQNEAQSSGFYIVDRKHDLNFIMGPEYPEKEDFVNVFANTIYEKIKETTDRPVQDSE